MLSWDKIDIQGRIEWVRQASSQMNTLFCNRVFNRKRIRVLQFSGYFIRCFRQCREVNTFDADIVSVMEKFCYERRFLLRPILQGMSHCYVHTSVSPFSATISRIQIELHIERHFEEEFAREYLSSWANEKLSWNDSKYSSSFLRYVEPVPY